MIRPSRVERICVLCSKEFTVTPSVMRKSNSGKYCSKICSDLSKKGKQKDAWVDIICQRCGKSFITQRYRKEDAQFCSRDCAKKRFETQCLLCGKYFFNVPSRQKGGRGKYCSKRCHNLSKKGISPSKETIAKMLRTKLQLSANTRINKSCEYCNKEFFVTRRDDDRRFCSSECAAKYRRNKPSGRKGAIVPDENRYWTTERQRLLIQNWPIRTKKEILDLFPSKSWTAILNEIHQIRTKRRLTIPKRANSDVAINVWNHQNEIVEQYLRETSSSDIAKQFDVDRELILTVLRKNGIRVRSNSEALTIHQNKPGVRRANSERAIQRLYSNPEKLDQLLEHGKKSRKRSIYTDAGVAVYSNGEREIANFLDKQKIKYVMNKKLRLGDKLVIPDFWLPEQGVYIEYYGYQGAFHYDTKTGEKKGHYDQRMLLKQELYRQYNIPLIELTYSDFRKKLLIQKISAYLAARK